MMIPAGYSTCSLHTLHTLQHHHHHTIESSKVDRRQRRQKTRMWTTTTTNVTNDVMPASGYEARKSRRSVVVSLGKMNTQHTTHSTVWYGTVHTRYKKDLIIVAISKSKVSHMREWFSSILLVLIHMVLCLPSAISLPAAASSSRPHPSTSTMMSMSMSSNKSSSDGVILTHLQRVDPTISSFQTTKYIKQGSAEGFIIETQTTAATVTKKKDEENKNSPTSSTSTSTPSHLFVKWVDPKKYSHKVWADLRRTIHYTRTEVRFYTEILPLLKANVKDDWPLCPTIYLAEYNVEGLMEEDESTEAQQQPTRMQSQSHNDSSNLHSPDPQYDENDTTALEGRYGVIVMDNANANDGDNNCFQQAPLNQEMALASVQALAKFHATAFQNEPILNQVSERLCRYGGSYHLKNRNPKEMNHLISAWEGFMKDIVTPYTAEHGAPQGQGFFEDDERVKNLGSRLHRAAHYISKVLSPSPSCPYATIVHGDYKAMNIFFKKDNGIPILIDFASTGVGLGMSDLAMHVAHVALPEDLENGLEDILVKAYYEALVEAVPILVPGDDLRSVYTEQDAIRHYQFAVVDYFRFILGRQWNNADLDVFAKRNKDTNFAMVNRSVDAALSFVERTDRYLAAIEKEMEDTTCEEL